VTAWLDRARSYLGTREIPGPRHTALILKWWSAIRAPFTDDETPWCAAFVGGVLVEVGLNSTRSARARSYLSYGDPVAPCVGAILVFERGPVNGHVGFYVAEDSEAYHVLGGNQSDAVTITRISKARLIGCRWPDLRIARSGPVIAPTGKTLSTNEA